jgi:hypothetical protein
MVPPPGGLIMIGLTFASPFISLITQICPTTADESKLIIVGPPNVGLTNSIVSSLVLSYTLSVTIVAHHI